MDIVRQLDSFHKTNGGHVVVGLVELAAAYGVAVAAINSGAWWEWLIVLILLIGVTQHLFKGIMGFFYGKHKTTKA